MKTIQHNNLCEIGKTLSMMGMGIFLDHVENCKKCYNHKNQSKCTLTAKQKRQLSKEIKAMKGKR